ncbi:hypothetical protein F5X99DRAFT_428344 [Biscogniauxia marginata]|nr:hypothetical protein F5X99DRAFT_428344 [Biscogniauxia marginata]
MTPKPWSMSNSPELMVLKPVLTLRWRVILVVVESGDRHGCKRCKASMSSCTYTQSSTTKGSRKKLRRLPAFTPTRGLSPESTTSYTPGQRNSQELQINDLTRLNEKKEGARNVSESLSSTSAQSPIDPPSDQDGWWGLLWQVSSGDSSEPPGVSGLLDVEIYESLNENPPIFESDILSLVPSPIESVPAEETWKHPPLQTQYDVSIDISPTPETMPSTRAISISSNAPINDCDQEYPFRCLCLDTMVQLLEDMGMEGSDMVIDMLLACLERDIRTCEDVLSCTNCKVYVNNSMLFAAVVHLLSATASSVAAQILLIVNEHARTTGTVEGAMIFDCYSVNGPGMKAWTIFNTALHHLNDLVALLSCIKTVIGSKKGPREMLVKAEDNVTKICLMVHELSNSLEIYR